MAQREEKTEIRVKETLTLCVNNCGFYGNPGTNNLCQACFLASKSGMSHPPRHARSDDVRRSEAPSLTSGSDHAKVDPEASVPNLPETASPPVRVVNRCSGCQRRVGLTGFRCRCGELFCGEHRYSDRHDCSFDYKTAGRQAISRENPVVRASKMIRI
ncbi:hypothetical protein HPP92_017290 [Vanilla planifolia]|uniref:Uncharacterized protein n=1 Tax=Vanilla planifolia TaxID=51239 RepID=A0A835UNA6_VANPL|nr:hypothetical protein HPP92_017290 [Vanilla planifolia]